MLSVLREEVETSWTIVSRSPFNALLTVMDGRVRALVAVMCAMTCLTRCMSNVVPAEEEICEYSIVIISV